MQIPKLSSTVKEDSGSSMLVEEVHIPDAGGTGAAPFNCLRVVLQPGEHSEVDIHDSRECWLIASGKGILLYDGQTSVEVVPGDILFYDSRRSHQLFNDGPEEILFFSIWWR